MKTHIDAPTCMDSIWHQIVELELDHAAAAYAQRSCGYSGNQLAPPNPSLSFTMLAKSFLYGCICVGVLMQTLLAKDTFLPSFCPAFSTVCYIMWLNAWKFEVFASFLHCIIYDCLSGGDSSHSPCNLRGQV